MITLLFVLLLTICASSWSQDVISFPIRLHDSHSNTITEEVVSFNISSPEIDQDVRAYCEKNAIQLSFCALLHGKVMEAARVMDANRIHLPNAHLSRTAAAQRAEIERTLWYDGSHDYGEIKGAEIRASQRVLSMLDTIIVQKMVVIHSCTWAGNENANLVLSEIIQQLRFYGLYAAVDLIVVLNYGEVVDEGSRTSWGTKVVVVQVHSSTSYFEVPSLRIVHNLSKHIDTTSSAAAAGSVPHVLYLHTKGVSYQRTHPQIRDWVDMMLYFLAGRHRACSHLLSSEEVDCIGTNYKTAPFDMFSGNFWWSTVSYVASLPELRYEVSGKYEAETWLLSRRGTRVFVMHSTNINHAEQEYPPQCYAEAAHRVAPFAWSSHRMQTAADDSVCHASGVGAEGCKPGRTVQLGNAPPPRPRDGLCGSAVTAWQARRFWQLL